jgi:hypothetical protein
MVISYIVSALMVDLMTFVFNVFFAEAKLMLAARMFVSCPLPLENPVLVHLGLEVLVRQPSAFVDFCLLIVQLFAVLGVEDEDVLTFVPDVG